MTSFPIRLLSLACSLSFAIPAVHAASDNDTNTDAYKTFTDPNALQDLVPPLSKKIDTPVGFQFDDQGGTFIVNNLDVSFGNDKSLTGIVVAPDTKLILPIDSKVKVNSGGDTVGFLVKENGNLATQNLHLKATSPSKNVSVGIRLAGIRFYSQGEPTEIIVEGSNQSVGIDADQNSEIIEKGILTIQSSGSGIVISKSNAEANPERVPEIDIHHLIIEPVDPKSQLEKGFSVETNNPFRITVNNFTIKHAKDAIVLKSDRDDSNEEFKGIGHYEIEGNIRLLSKYHMTLTLNEGSFIKGDIVLEQASNLDLKGQLELIGDVVNKTQNFIENTKIPLHYGNIYLKNSSIKGGLINIGHLELSNSRWEITKNSKITNKSNIKDSEIFFSSPETKAQFEPKTLELHDFSNKSNRFTLNIDPNVNVQETPNQFGRSDRLIIYTVSNTPPKLDGELDANLYIRLKNINNNPDLSKQEGVGTVLIEGSGERDFDVLAVDDDPLINKFYVLKTREKGPSDWDVYLDSISQPDYAPVVDATRSQLASSYYALLDEIKLQQRMGELRFSQDDALKKNLWVHFNTLRSDRKRDFFYDSRLRTLEVGLDRQLETHSLLRQWVGVSALLRDGTTDYQYGSGRNHQKGLSVYWTGLHPNGIYFDTWLRYLNNNGHFDIHDDVQRYKANFHQWGLTANLEVGKRVPVKHHFYVEPQLQVSMAWLHSDAMRIEHDDMLGQLDDISAITRTRLGFLGRVGTNIGWNISPNSEIYMKASVIHTFRGGFYNYFSTPQYHRNTYARTELTWGQVGLGTAVNYKNNMNLFADVEYNFGEASSRTWRWNLGLRYNF